MDATTDASTPPTPTAAAASPLATGRSSGTVAAGNSGGGGGASQPTLNARLLRLVLKIGLAVTVSFHFAWVGRQLSSLGAHGAYDSLLIAPEYAEDGTDLYAAPPSPGRRRTASSSPFDPRGKALPSHPFPNAELRDLVSSDVKYDCADGLVYVDDHVLPDNVTHPPGRRIPRLFHVTSKSRCMTPSFASNIQRWKDALGSKYSIYVHDDEAVNRFIYQKDWTEFPELKEVMACVTAGVRMRVRSHRA